MVVFYTVLYSSVLYSSIQYFYPLSIFKLCDFHRTSKVCMCVVGGDCPNLAKDFAFGSQENSTKSIAPSVCENKGATQEQKYSYCICISYIYSYHTYMNMSFVCHCKKENML